MITNIASIAAAKTVELVEFYNAHTEKQIKKFRDRATAEAKVTEIVVRLEEERKIAAAEVKAAEEKAKAATLWPALGGAKVEPQVVRSPGLRNPGDVFASSLNAAKLANQDAEQKPLTVPQALAAVLEADRVGSVKKVLAFEHRENIRTSFALDRETLCLETGEIFPNAGRAWQNGEYMTNGQGDRLTRTLYAAAKRGERAEFKVVGPDNVTRTFVLVQYANEAELEGATGEE